MNGALLILVSGVALFLAYVVYGSYIARRMGIDPSRPTPAHTMTDGVDYVPAPSFVLMGHHFASIAGAAPIAGPITAAVFGWLPVALWVLIGGIFVGAVHDFTALVASVRHNGKSIGEVIGENVGPGGRTLFLVFAWLTLCLVVAAFANIVAGTFASVPQAASSSMMFMLLAVGFGFAIYRANYGLVISSVVGVALLFLAVYLGYLFPLKLGVEEWKWVLLAYIALASTAPVWILLQPRDYLNSFLLYFSMIGAVLGIVFGNPTITLPAYGGFNPPSVGLLFPMLFVTVACGAVSGFHALVASGTTAKQLGNERDAKRIGYGAMLIESLLAMTAIIAAGSFASDKFAELMKGGAFNVYANGIAQLLTPFGVPLMVGVTFFSLAASAFALTSLDTACRLGRYTLQELGQVEGFKAIPGMSNRYVATTLTILLSALLLFSGQFSLIWPLFGSANQLVAALALLAVATWLLNKKKGNAFVVIPMVFMLAVTLAALALMFQQRLAQGNIMLAIMSAVLFLLAVVLAWMGYQVLSGARKAPVIASIQGGSGEEK
ncbi:MAG: carbon starvation CstA family protein [Chloroflexota bacterium]